MRFARAHGGRTGPRSPLPAPLTAALRRFRDLGPGPVPAGTIAAADTAIALRIARLHGAAPPIARPIRWTIALAALAVATTPASLYILPL